MIIVTKLQDTSNDILYLLSENGDKIPFRKSVSLPMPFLKVKNDNNVILTNNTGIKSHANGYIFDYTKLTAVIDKNGVESSFTPQATRDEFIEYMCDTFFFLSKASFLENVTDFQFATYADATADLSIFSEGDIVFVEETTGFWLIGTEKSQGHYYFNGTELEYVTESLKDRIKLNEAELVALRNIVDNLQLTGSTSWGDIATSIKYNGNDTVIASGEVLEGEYGGNTIYRFRNSTEDVNGYSIEDSFYSNFDGVNLTNLIITRG